MDKQRASTKIVNRLLSMQEFLRLLIPVMNGVKNEQFQA
jgi:hypothetical protein